MQVHRSLWKETRLKALLHIPKRMNHNSSVLPSSEASSLLAIEAPMACVLGNTDLLEHILSHVDARTLVRASRVCRAWHDAASDGDAAYECARPPLTRAAFTGLFAVTPRESFAYPHETQPAPWGGKVPRSPT